MLLILGLLDRDDICRNHRFANSPQTQVEMEEEARLYGEPTLAQLSRAREYTRQMRERGQIRLTREEKAEAPRQKWAKFLERYPNFEFW